MISSISSSSSFLPPESAEVATSLEAEILSGIFDLPDRLQQLFLAQFSPTELHGDEWRQLFELAHSLAAAPGGLNRESFRVAAQAVRIRIDLVDMILAWRRTYEQTRDNTLQLVFDIVRGQAINILRDWDSVFLEDAPIVERLQSSAKSFQQLHRRLIQSGHALILSN